jgi:hypothetical protein
MPSQLLRTTADPEEQLNECKYLYLRHLHEPIENSCRIVCEEASAQGHLARQVDPTLNEALAGILSGASPILSDSLSRTFEIEFAEYVSYTVTNECYGRYPELPEAFTGNLFRRFGWSHLLEFTKRTTYACDEHPGPGPLLHFEIVCLNHVIDVITTVEPKIALVHALNLGMPVVN